MASSQTQQVTKQGLERSRLSLVIHDVNTQIADKDIERIIMSKIGKPLPKIQSGNIYAVNGRTLRKIFLNFKQETKLNELMKSGPIKYGNEELIISRHNPKNIPFSGIMTCALLLQISKTSDAYGLEKKLVESDINKYFGKFGKVIYCQWLNEYEAILQFNSYDIVDQIILSDISHAINGINIHIEKTREIQKKNIIEIAQHPYCIHVTNISNDVTSEELSSIFNVSVAHIVLQPGYQLNQHLVSNDQLNSEAWIKLIGDEKQTRDLAIKVSNKYLRLNGVPKLIDANVNNTKNNTPWIIMGNIEGVTLHDFVPTTSIDLHNALIITLKLLHTVKQINRRNVIHRNINPHNIIIKTSSIKENNQNQSSFENINLVLIDFDLAYIDQQTDEHNQKMDGIFYSDNIDLINPLKCKRPQSNQIFYRVPQIEKRSMINHVVKNEQDDNLCRSSTIDTSHICAILFWLITKSYPRESRDIDGKAPHEKKHHIRIIEEELTRASGVWQGKEKRHPLEQHLYLIFDRAFANPDRQWPIEELEYQLELTLQLTKKTNEEEEEEYNLPSMSFKNEQKESLSYIPMLTIDSSLQLALFIDSIKRQVEQHYDTLHWSNSEINEWSIKGQQVKHHDILHFQKQQYKTSLKIEWTAIINDKTKLDMNIKIKVNQNTVIDLPLGVWQQYNTDNIKNDIRKNVLIELKNLVDVLY
ncbi:unnamed protein product, partial [Rotaria magnacalcarata]